MMHYIFISCIKYSVRDLLCDVNNRKEAICVTYVNDVSTPSGFSSR